MAPLSHLHTTAKSPSELLKDCARSRNILKIFKLSAIEYLAEDDKGELICVIPWDERARVRTGKHCVVCFLFLFLFHCSHSCPCSHSRPPTILVSPSLFILFLVLLHLATFASSTVLVLVLFPSLPLLALFLVLVQHCQQSFFSIFSSFFSFSSFLQAKTYIPTIRNGKI